MTNPQRNHKIPRIGAATAITVAGVGVMTGSQPAAAANLVVTTASDVRDATIGDETGPDGFVSLADAIYLANDDADLSTITFAITDPASGDAPHTIDLIGSPPEITEDLTITGPGRDQLTLTSTLRNATLDVGNSAALTVSALTIDAPTNVADRADGINAYDAGAMRVEDVTISTTGTAIRWWTAGAGAAAVTIDDVDITDTEDEGIDAVGPSQMTLNDVAATTIGGRGISVFDATEGVTATGIEVTDAAESAMNIVDGPSVVMNGVVATRTAGGVDPTAGQILTARIVDVDLDDVEVTGATGSGLTIDEATTFDVSEVDVIESGTGLSIVESVGGTISATELTDNTEVGLSVSALSGSLGVTDLTASGNGELGVSFDSTTVVLPPDPTGVADLTISVSTITENAGGGISVVESGEVEFDEVTVSGNGTGPGASLGGIFFGEDGTPSGAAIRRSTISENVGDFGGGVAVINHQGTLDIESTDLSGNESPFGEAIAARAFPGDLLVTVTDSNITDHAGSGSEVFADGSDITIHSSTINNNSGVSVVEAMNTGGMSVRNSTVTANTVSNSVFRASTNAFMEVSQTTATGNQISGATSGVLRSDTDPGLFSATNSILTGNGVPLVASDSTGPVTVDYSLVPVGSAAGGTGNVEVDDPQVGVLQDNGGVTHTMLPAKASAAIDAGDPAGPSGPAASLVLTQDQRALTRVVDERIDIGSVERQLSPFVIGLPPARILETRSGPTFETIDGDFEGIGRRSNGETTTLQVAGRAGVPLDAEAVVINVTAVDPDSVGFVTVHPCLVNPPLASSLNFRGNVDSGNEIVAELNGDGELCLFNRNVTDLVVDVVGYVPADSRYSPVGPARLLDTRDTGSTIDGLFEKGGIRTSGTELELDVAGRGGVSDDAVAVVINVTAVKPESIGFVTVHPCLPEEPTAASLNFEPGVNRGNEIVAQLNDDGKLCLYTFGTAQLIVDVVGQLSSENTYEPVAPARLFETRTDPNGTIDDLQEGDGRLTAREVITVQAGGRANVPESATGVVVNATAIRTDLRGFITVWDCVGDRPLAASLNYTAGEIVGNELVVDLNADGEFCLFTNRGTDLTVDVVGYLT